MLFKIDKSDNSRITESLNVTSGESILLSFSEDGKQWVTFQMSPKILHKILIDDREARNLVGDVDVHYKPLNGHSYEVGPKTE